MRILIVDTWYERVLDAVYQAHRGLSERGYDDQWRTLMSTFFGTADSYSHYLGELGHEAHEVIANCAPLEAAWAREHDVRPRQPGTLGRLRGEDETAALVLARADDYRPDVVYVQNLSLLAPATLSKLRRRALLVGQLGIDPPPPRHLERFDLVVTSLPHLVPRLHARGLDAEYFRIGFEPRVLKHVDTEAGRDGAVFVGAFGKAQHGRASALLAEAAEVVPFRVWGVGLDDWPPGSALARAYQGEAWGLEMYARLAGATIAINRHADHAEDNANNMRLYEATGVGTMLLTDAKRNLADLFEPDREVVTYESAAELAEKVRHYLEHEDERAAIARAGQARTLAEHTYADRMRELVGILERRLP